ncbi:TPA: signal peptidase I [Candidatus Ventrenecus stercoripullorum]|nr:signal peptidase I [Candidatus Ventrenecus stercoripullorum]
MKLLKEAIPYIIIIVVVLLLRAYVVTPIRVNGLSMYDTLEGDEIMILWKLGEIERYDIVVADVKVSGSDDVVIKRVYGLPGETISCEDGKIYINGSLIEDEYGYRETSDFGPVTLGENEYFLLGDNREISLDSRVFGKVTRDEIEGTTNFILLPFKKFGNVS